MKECSAYGRVAAHSGQTEDIYENPQWIDNTMQLVYKILLVLEVLNALKFELIMYFSWPGKHTNIYTHHRG